MSEVNNNIIEQHSEYMDQADLLFFKKLEKIIPLLTQNAQLMAKQFKKNLQEKMKEKGMTLIEIKESLKDNKYAQSLFSLLLPESEAAQVLKKKFQKEAKNTVKKIKEAGFLSKTWNAIQRVASVVVEKVVLLWDSIPTSVKVIGVVLLLLLGSWKAVLAFLNNWQSSSSAATFGALKSISNITPKTFGAMVKPLKKVISNSHLGLPS